jgi:hypothetical protein
MRKSALLVPVFCLLVSGVHAEQPRTMRIDYYHTGERRTLVAQLQQHLR